MNETFLVLKVSLEAASTTQTAATTAWHSAEPSAEAAGQSIDVDNLNKLVLEQHLQNFLLWHVEDKARALDVSDSVIADCKRQVDKINQKRNDLMEKIDAMVVGIMTQHLPAKSTGKHNSETIGMIIDRLSILALKIFHMQEQTARKDVTIEHLQNCQSKLEVLEEQRHNLLQALLELIDDYAAGRKAPVIYRQFKMYNDPNLNPELYKSRS